MQRSEHASLLEYYFIFFVMTLNSNLKHLCQNWDHYYVFKLFHCSTEASMTKVLARLVLCMRLRKLCLCLLPSPHLFHQMKRRVYGDGKLYRLLLDIWN
jgi:hypothetical protein